MENKRLDREVALKLRSFLELVHPELRRYLPWMDSQALWRRYRTEFVNAEDERRPHAQDAR
jgi:hypothetical protein